MKKFVSTILCLLLLVTLLLTGVFSTNTLAATKEGTTGDCVWSLDGTELTICGNGAMKNYSYSDFVDGIGVPWGADITKVNIKDGVTNIGDYAFYKCKSLETIAIADSVKTIGKSAFSNCISLKSVKVPSSVASINEYAFYKCTSLSSVEIPDSVTTIGDYAFYASAVNVIIIPNGLSIIRAGVFGNCTNLVNVVIPRSVNNIGSYAFAGCDAIEHVWYNGDATDKYNLKIYNNNSKLQNAQWHFICRDLHSYVSICDATCDNCDWARNVENNAHNWDEGVVTKESTCKEAGNKKYTCKDCGASKDETVAKNNNHTFSSWNVTETPSCTVNGKEMRICSICKTEETRSVSSTGHFLGSWEIVKQPTCDTNGQQTKKML